MRRNVLFIAIVIITTMACGLVNKTTPTSTPTLAPTQPVVNQPPTRTPSVSPAGTQVSTPQATITTTPEEPTITPYPTSVLDASMESEINTIQTQVVQERGLQAKNQVPVVLLTSSELGKNVVNDFLADYTDEDMANDIYELTSIGLLSPGFDLKTFYINLLTEQIAGYYDNDIKEMFVVSDEGFIGPEHLTYAHEFTHALQDQNYDIKNGLKYDDDYCETHTEYCAAVQALIEGDATMSEFTWYQGFATATDQQQIVQYYNSLKSPVYDSAPEFLKRDFVFPYNQGLTFVQDMHNLGSWAAVDAVYKNPPVSTEQILHPSLYPANTPIPVDLPDLTATLGSGWREVSRNEMGEWYTYLVLSAGADERSRLPDNDAQTAAAGWGGDEYLVLHNDTTNSTVFVMKDIWDTADDAAQFSAALQRSLNSRFGLVGTQQGDTFTWSYSGGFSSLLSSASTTIWIIAPDQATAQTISGVVTP